MPVAALIVALALPALSVVHTYSGVPGVALYVAIVIAAVSAGPGLLLPRFLDRVSDRAAVRLGAATLLLLLTAFAIVYPLANAGAFGPGSDADDAIDVGARALLRGEIPVLRPYLSGKPDLPVPWCVAARGAVRRGGDECTSRVVLAGCLLLFARHLIGDARIALVALWVMVGLSPVVVQELLVGTDHLANAIYVLIPATMLVRSVHPGEHARRRSLVWAALLGVALSSRPNFALLLPLVLGSLTQAAGFATAVRLTAVAALAYAVVTVPFFLFDPAGFSPLYNAGMKLELFGSGLPFTAALIPISGAIAAAVLGWRRTSLRWPGFLGSAAIVQAVPVAVVVALELTNGPDLFPVSLSYGLLALPFAVLAAAASGSDVDFDAARHPRGEVEQRRHEQHHQESEHAVEDR